MINYGALVIFLLLQNNRIHTVISYTHTDTTHIGTTDAHR